MPEQNEVSEPATVESRAVFNFALQHYKAVLFGIGVRKALVFLKNNNERFS